MKRRTEIIENAHFLLGNGFVLPRERYYNKKYIFMILRIAAVFPGRAVADTM